MKNLNLKLKLQPNELYSKEQTLKCTEKVMVLVGENGSGKSKMLESIFQQKLTGQDHQDLRIVCFSSGQNESFTQKINSHVQSLAKPIPDFNMDCHYYDKSWSKLFIFLAKATVPEGHTSNLMHQRKLINSLADSNVELEFTLEIDAEYCNAVKVATNEGNLDVVNPKFDGKFHSSFISFVRDVLQLKYDFTKPLAKQKFTVNSNQIREFSDSLYSDAEKWQDSTMGNSANPQSEMALDFFTKAATNDRFIDKTSISLFFKDKLNLELIGLSDAEYQLLFLYALCDLLDSDKTLFLLDDADAHLYHDNIASLWPILHEIKGYVIITTHLVDSISADKNTIDNIVLIEKGKIVGKDIKIRKLLRRLSVLPRAREAELEVAGNMHIIVLVDNIDDWIILIKLAKRKGFNIEKLNNYHAISKSSSYQFITESFAKQKVDWVCDLSSIRSKLHTKCIFLLCDRDEAPLQWNENDNVQVKDRYFNSMIDNISWPNGAKVDVFLLAWHRREIKNYLLSYTALVELGLIDAINNEEIALKDHLRKGDPADGNISIANFRCKNLIDPLIHFDSKSGLDYEKLDALITMIPPDEISIDIDDVFKFLTEGYKNVISKRI